MKAGAWQPPAGSWEDHIDSIDVAKDDTSTKLVVFLNWKNGKKTKHSTDVVYKRCPQKVDSLDRHECGPKAVLLTRSSDAAIL